jgi:hypothetical protein
MPKVPLYTLAWSPTTATYELYRTDERKGLGIVPDSRAWFAWLDQVSSFAFSGKSGHYTARKEAKQRGGGVRCWANNDPTRFLSYLIAALQTLDAQLGATALALLHTSLPRHQRLYWRCSRMTSRTVIRAMLPSCWMITTSSTPTPFIVG